jgi:hypothetical protein
MHPATFALARAAATALALSLAVVVSDSAGASRPAFTRWSIVPSPNEEGANWLAAIDASAGNDAWAVGYYIGDEGLYETLSAHWDGSAWTLVETLNVGQTGDWLYGVAAVSPSEAWAVGTTAGSVDTYTSTTLIEHWTGSVWSVVPSPNPSDDPIYGANQLYDVRAFAPNDVWAVGWQWTPIGSAPLVVRWDGRRWRVSPTPDDEYRQLVALDGTSSSDIWAVGHSFNFNDGYQALAMHWDGRTWAVVPRRSSPTTSTSTTSRWSAPRMSGQSATHSPPTWTSSRTSSTGTARRGRWSPVRASCRPTTTSSPSPRSRRTASGRPDIERSTITRSSRSWSTGMEPSGTSSPRPTAPAGGTTSST